MHACVYIRTGRRSFSYFGVLVHAHCVRVHFCSMYVYACIRTQERGMLIDRISNVKENLQ